jgi:hypothetical protein
VSIDLIVFAMVVSFWAVGFVSGAAWQRQRRKQPVLVSTAQQPFAYTFNGTIQCSAESALASYTIFTNDKGEVESVIAA